MRHQGKIIKWNAEKGFGFLRTNGDNKDIFFHISDFKNRNIAPKINALVSYSISQDAKQRNQAIEIEYVHAKPLHQTGTKLNPLVLVLFILFLALIIERTIHRALPPYVLLVILLANLLVFLMYYFDKSAAQQGKWRTPEDTLHGLSLLGGWGGAHIAQKWFRHKHKKTSFMLTYWFTVVVSWATVIWLSFFRIDWL